MIASVKVDTEFEMNIIYAYTKIHSDMDAHGEIGMIYHLSNLI
jgi:hypothetical protein